MRTAQRRTGARSEHQEHPRSAGFRGLGWNPYAGQCHCHDRARVEHREPWRL